MYKIAICDDDIKYRKSVRQIIQEFGWYMDDLEFYELESGEALLKEDINFDVLFLDIQMPGIDGDETARQFRINHKDTLLVFCTNYQPPTTKSFKVQPFRYIMKDIFNKMLRDEIKDILEEMTQRSASVYLNVIRDGTIHRVPLKLILYISVLKRGALVYLFQNSDITKLHSRESVKELYLELKGAGFEYAHNSYIVNMKNIIAINKSIIVLKDRSKLNISRSKRVQFDKRFSNFLKVRYKRK